MSADATGTRAEMCKCGHARKSHIYEEGACRPGFVCQESCRQFEPVDASSNRVPITREDEQRALDKGMAEERAKGWRFKPERSAEEESRLADNLHHAIPNRATVCERCGSGLLDGKHIASYPPCNGEDATRNRAATITLDDAVAAVMVLHNRKIRSGKAALKGMRGNVAQHRFEEARVLLEEVIPALRKAAT